MTSTEDLESIASWVCKVDPLRQNPPLRAGDTFFTNSDRTKQEWKVVNVAANAHDGFQAAAVVPVVNGVEDCSHIYISYAGTNFDDLDDVATDLGIVLGTRMAQADDAMEFAEDIRKSFPGATYETVGHSLGGYLAQYVAAEHRWASTTFNAPDAWRLMSADARKWLDEQNGAGTNPLKNYVNKFDVVGNFLVNRTGASVFVEDVPGRTLSEYHSLGTVNGKAQSFTYDADGEIIGAGAEQVDFGVILYNAGQTSAAQSVWKVEKDSGYPKVLVAMEPAIALAITIGGLATQLKAIESTNKELGSVMQAALDEAKREYAAYHPLLSHADIDDCVHRHALEVAANLDHTSVETVNKRVDHQIALVEALEDGIHNAVVNALVHDAKSAAHFTTH